jgi:hypothetical protein
MANTFIYLAGSTLGSASASITLSSIPSGYTDLLLKTSTRNTGNAGGMYLTVNSNAANYVGVRLGQSDTTLYQDSNAGLSDKIFLRAEDTRATADAFQCSDVYFASYLNSRNKNMAGESGAVNNASSYFGAELESPRWNDTSAITSITLVPEAGNFATYSSVILYGIKNS